MWRIFRTFSIEELLPLFSQENQGPWSWVSAFQNIRIVLTLPQAYMAAENFIVFFPFKFESFKLSTWFVNNFRDKFLEEEKNSPQKFLEVAEHFGSCL